MTKVTVRIEDGEPDTDPVTLYKSSNDSIKWKSKDDKYEIEFPDLFTSNDTKDQAEKRNPSKRHSIRRDADEREHKYKITRVAAKAGEASSEDKDVDGQPKIIVKP